MNDINGFAPISDTSATLLILGSMPSQVSLSKQQYYAHKRNSFWPIMLSIFNEDLALTTYQMRKNYLLRHNIALWDVLQSCHRLGSLDAAITMSTIKANDFHTFFVAHSAIKKVCFNGAKAESIFMKTVLPIIKEQFSFLEYIRLPSSSPAHAAMSFQEKHDIWKRSIVNDHV